MLKNSNWMKRGIKWQTELVFICPGNYYELKAHMAFKSYLRSVAKRMHRHFECAFHIGVNESGNFIIFAFVRPLSNHKKTLNTSLFYDNFKGNEVIVIDLEDDFDVDSEIKEISEQLYEGNDKIAGFASGVVCDNGRVCRNTYSCQLAIEQWPNPIELLKVDFEK